MACKVRAFTLLEMVLAVALAAMLMVLVLTVATGVRRTQAKLGQVAPDEVATARLIGLISRDLAEADEILITPNGFSIIGPGRLGDERLENRHGTTRTTYLVVSSGNLRFLLRRQTALDDRSNRNSLVELLMTGVESLNLKSPSQPEGAMEPFLRNEVESCWLSVTWTDPSRPPMRKQIWLN